MKGDEKSGLYESDYEKIRNKLSLFQMVLDTVKLDVNYAADDSIVKKASNDLEEVKEILNRMERNNKGW